MTIEEFKKSLQERISPREADALRDGGEDLVINEFNLGVCLRLLEDESACSSPVPLEKARSLETDLKNYLDEYMQDKPAGHKWIIIACLYLTFVERQPMHPQAAAGWTEKDGHFYCPHMVQESFICSCCMCEPAV